MSKKVHIVPHMHWDREWYFTAEESRILLLNNMEEILTKLENEDEYKYYVLDGQTCILEDFLSIKPYEKDRIKKLVDKGKLIIGPWYTQTDEIIVSGESIVRNLMYGIRDAKKIGQYMDIGYLPDSFGQSRQMPQILNGFGIKRSIFWRGVSERHGTSKTEFLWSGHGDSKVLVQIMPLGYAIGKYLPTDKISLKKRMDEYLSVLERGASGENILVANGHDQMPVQKNIFEVIDVLKELYPDKDFFISSYQKLFEELEKDISKYDTISGEFLDGKYMRVHKSIYSTRMDIKNIHAKLEHKLVNILEPLASIAFSLGLEYYHGLFEKIWKEIMKNQAHDSIACCCSDKVHREIMSRFFIAEDMIDNLINYYKRKITDATEDKNGMDKIVLFNTLPYEREEIIKINIITKLKEFSIVDLDNNNVYFNIIEKNIVDAGLIDRQLVHYENYDPFIEYVIEIKASIPSMGYRVYYVSDKSKEINNIVFNNSKSIENNYYKIDINNNGSISILNKEDNELYENVLMLEDCADDGDEYNYSPLENDKAIYSDRVSAKIKTAETNYSKECFIKYDMNIPKDIESRRNNVLDSILPVELKIGLRENSKYIKVKILLNNNAIDHRVRILIPSKISSLFSFSDNQFGTITRDTKEKTLSVWEKEKWKEKPISINPMISFVDLNNNEKGVSVITDGLREYEIISPNLDTIAITLFRSVGVIGKENLLWRPGRPSGIKMPTPDSQMIREMTFDFTIVLHSKNHIDANIPLLAKEYSSPIEVYNKIPYNAMKLNPLDFNTPSLYSLFNIKGGAVLSAVKKAEDINAIIIRMFNPSEDKTISSEIEIKNKFSRVCYTDLNENIKENIDMVNNKVIIKDIKPCEIKTIALIL